MEWRPFQTSMRNIITLLTEAFTFVFLSGALNKPSTRNTRDANDFVHAKKLARRTARMVEKIRGTPYFMLCYSCSSNFVSTLKNDDNENYFCT